MLRGPTSPLARHLRANGVAAAAVHGGNSPPQRTRTLEQLRTGTINTLIATAPAA